MNPYDRATAVLIIGKVIATTAGIWGALALVTWLLSGPWTNAAWTALAVVAALFVGFLIGRLT